VGQRSDFPLLAEIHLQNGGLLSPSKPRRLLHGALLTLSGVCVVIPELAPQLIKAWVTKNPSKKLDYNLRRRDGRPKLPSS